MVFAHNGCVLLIVPFHSVSLGIAPMDIATKDKYINQKHCAKWLLYDIQPHKKYMASFYCDKKKLRQKNSTEIAIFCEKKKWEKTKNWEI